MSRLNKSVLFIIIAIILIAAFLLPAQRLVNHLANSQSEKPAIVQSVAGTLPGTNPNDCVPTTYGYTWAG